MKKYIFTWGTQGFYNTLLVNHRYYSWYNHKEHRWVLYREE